MAENCINCGDLTTESTREPLFIGGLLGFGCPDCVASYEAFQDQQQERQSTRICGQFNPPVTSKCWNCGQYDDCIERDWNDQTGSYCRPCVVIVFGD